LRDDAAVTESASAHPTADAGALQALARDARAEPLRGTPPHRYRELFRRIKAAVT